MKQVHNKAKAMIEGYRYRPYRPPAEPRPRRPRQPKQVPPTDPLQRTVFDAGGTLIYPQFPSKEKWDRTVAKYASFAPGCGAPTHVDGTNGGQMPCGAQLTQFGKTSQYFCAPCSQKQASHVTETLQKAKHTVTDIMARAQYKADRLKAKGWTRKDFGRVLFSGPGVQKQVADEIKARTKTVVEALLEDNDENRCVSIILFRNREDPETLTIERKYAPEAGKRASPGGHVNKSESFSDAAYRELKEETGISADKLTEFDERKTDDGHEVHFFYGIVDDDEKAKASDDASKAQWLKIDDLPDLAFSNNSYVKSAAAKAFNASD